MIDITIRIVSSEFGALTETEQRVLNALSSGVVLGANAPTADTPKASTVAKPAAKPAVAAPKAEPTPEPVQESLPADVEEEDLISSPSTKVTLEDVTKQATELMGAGKRDVVKAALETAGVKRVSELKGAALQVFSDALSAKA